jgi:16S rRNA (adenine1518-N6/adenine1519-N6)-dimethyltransferase
VANLPYESATAILARLLEARGRLSGISILLQREVAERIVATPGGRTYGYLSVRCQDLAATRLGSRLRPGAFRPAPKVDSALVHLTPREAPLRGEIPAGPFLRFVGGLFQSRRKTVANNLRRLTRSDAGTVRAVLAAAGLEENLRPEALDVGRFAELFRAAETAGLRLPGASGDPV